MDTILIPKLTQLNIPRQNVLFVVDPACFTRAEATEVTIAMVIQKRGFAVQRAPTNSPEMRISACEGLLQRQIDGGPFLRFSPAAAHLVAALDWGYRYKKSSAAGGEPTIDKNHYSHQGDAFNYFSLYFNGTAPNWQTKKREVKKASYVYT